MLSLVATNPFSAQAPRSHSGGIFQEFTKLVKATLIVVPFSRKTQHQVASAMASRLCSQSYSASRVGEANTKVRILADKALKTLIQSRHFRPSYVESLVYYGRGREKHCQSFGKYDIVLTTYNTVALDWKLPKSQRQKENATGLFSIHWHRVILDEGASWQLCLLKARQHYD